MDDTMHAFLDISQVEDLKFGTESENETGKETKNRKVSTVNVQ